MTPYYSRDGQTIYNGDCLEVMKSFPDKSFDLVLTDIPYNISQKSAGLRELDYGEWDKQYGMEETWVKEMLRVTKGTIVVFCAIQQIGVVVRLVEEDCSMRLLNWLKPNPTVLNSDKLYLQSCEFAVYGKKPNATYVPNYKASEFKYGAPQDRHHPTQKPLELFKEIILDTTNESDTILDPFMGSGTTLVAAKQLGRKATGIEISEKYCEIAKNRLAQDLLF